MNKKTEYAIITSFKKEDRDLSFFSYYYSLSRFFIKTLLYKLLNNKEKYIKYHLCFDELKNSKGHKIIGHPTTLLNLFASFKKTKTPYTYNKITKYTKYLLVLWTDKEEMKKIENLKFSRGGGIKKVITFPCAAKFDYDWQYLIPTYDCVDYTLVHSPWVIEHYRKKTPAKYMYKVKDWISGIEHTYFDNKIHNNIICYYKKIPFNQELEDFIKSLNINCTNIIYQSYNLYEWYEALKKADFVIFIQDCIETFGMAHTECWAHNRPAVVKFNENKYGGRTVPYLCDKNGQYYHNFDELKAIITEYKNDPKKFLNKFRPLEFMQNTLSLEKSLKIITDLCEEKEK